MDDVFLCIRFVRWSSCLDRSWSFYGGGGQIRHRQEQGLARGSAQKKKKKEAYTNGSILYDDNGKGVYFEWGEERT